MQSPPQRPRTILEVTCRLKQFGFARSRYGARLGEHSVLDCNVFKTKCRDTADQTLGAAMPGLEATAALPLMSGGMTAWLGHAARPFSVRRASIYGAESCTELSVFRKTSANDELMMVRGAQRALQGSRRIGGI